MRNGKSEEGWHVLPEVMATTPSDHRLALAESPRERMLADGTASCDSCPEA